MMTILSLGSGTKTITVTNALSTDSNNIVLALAGQAVLLMWNGTKWATLSAEGANTVD